MPNKNDLPEELDAFLNAVNGVAKGLVARRFQRESALEAVAAAIVILDVQPQEIVPRLQRLRDELISAKQRMVQ